MVWKFLSLVFLAHLSCAVIIHSHKSENSFSNGEPHKGWQIFKMFYPPKYQIRVRYEPHVIPKYEYEYAVSDANTGDHKRHFESRSADRVRGAYSLVEPDGSERHVHYQADDHSGFNAVVSKSILKHGDHAFSTYQMTRNHFPIEKQIHYYVKPLNDADVDLNNKPVTENDEETIEKHHSEEKLKETTTLSDLKLETTTDVITSTNMELTTQDMIIDGKITKQVESVTEINEAQTEKPMLDVIKSEAPDSIMSSSHFIPTSYFFRHFY